MTTELDWVKIVMTLLGGLALFLYGMDLMSRGMKKSVGKKIRNTLVVLTNNRFLGVVVGIVVTAIFQSSSATSVLLVSFVQAGIMQFHQTIGVLLGAGIGTTITAQLVAFQLAHYALIVIFFGFGVKLLAKNETIQNIGEGILGFGILFYGMDIMSTSMLPLRSEPAFIGLLKGLENPYLGILFALVFTAIIQSSAAFIGIVMVLSQQDWISLNAGIALVIGSNIGTTATGVLSSIGASRDAKRVALVNVIIRFCGSLIFVFWIPTFAKFLETFGDFSIGRHIANAHTVYNFGVTLLFLPFTKYFSKITYWFIPEKPIDKALMPVLRHLDYSMTKTPEMALQMARAEIARMASALRFMISNIFVPFEVAVIPRDRMYPQFNLIEAIELANKKVVFLNENIGKYLVVICQQELTDAQAQETFTLISVVTDLTRIGDIATNRIIPLAYQKRNLGVDFSEEGHDELKLFHTKICKQIARVKNCLDTVNPDDVKKIINKSEHYLDLEYDFRLKHLQRVRSEREESLETHEIHMELMDYLKQINVHASNIAKLMTSIKIFS